MDNVTTHKGVHQDSRRNTIQELKTLHQNPWETALGGEVPHFKPEVYSFAQIHKFNPHLGKTILCIRHT